MAALLTVGAVSCRKDKDEDQQPSAANYDYGTFAEGVYQPTYHISAVREDGTTVQVWSWATANLESVTDLRSACNHTFYYANDRLSKVTASTGPHNIFYYYSGSKLSKVEFVNTATQVVDMTMNISRTANEKISLINLEMSDDFMISTALSLIGVSKEQNPMSRILGEATFKQVVAMAQLMPRSKNGSKFNIDNYHFEIEYVWDGSNVKKEILTGTGSATGTLAEWAGVMGSNSALSSFMAMAAAYISDTTVYPAGVTINSTISYTYDDNRNPTYCLWMDGIDAANLSINNMTEAHTAGTAAASVTVTVPSTIPQPYYSLIVAALGGTTAPVTRNIDLSDDVTYQYTYNDHRLPSTVTVNGVTRSYVYENL